MLKSSCYFDEFMQITWNGLGSFTIVSKPLQGDVTVVTDPYDNKTGLRFPRTLSAAIVLNSHKGDEAGNTSAVSGEQKKKPFVIDHAGEYEVKGVFIKGVQANRKDGTEHTLYRIVTEGVQIGFLGALDRKLKDNELKALGNIDVLVVPVGGEDVLSAEDANEVVAQVEPRMVIPSHFDVKGLKKKRDDAEKFCKELACPTEEMNKLKVTKGSLPQEDMNIAVLSK